MCFFQIFDLKRILCSFWQIQIQNLSAVKSGKPRIKNLFLDLTLPVILNQFAIHLKFVWWQLLLVLQNKCHKKVYCVHNNSYLDAPLY